jgi:ABC-type sugar transport system permease subunit
MYKGEEPACVLMQEHKKIERLWDLASTSLIIVSVLYFVVVFVPVYFGGIYKMDAYQLSAHHEPKWYPLYWGQSFSADSVGITYLLARCLWCLIPCYAVPLLLSLFASLPVNWHRVNMRRKVLMLVSVVTSVAVFVISAPTWVSAGYWLVWH